MIFDDGIETFIAQRSEQMVSAADLLMGPVRQALADFGSENMFSGTIEAAIRVWDDTVEALGSDIPPSGAFLADLAASLALTTPPTDPPSDVQVDRIARWVATYAINAATTAVAAQSDGSVLLEWVTMRDEDVRTLHRPLQGVQRPVGDTFSVGQWELNFPGQPIGPPEVWINCRCVVRPVQGEEMSAQTFAIDMDAPVMETEHEFAFDPLPVGGVLVPLGERAGDGRQITEATWDDPPLALRWVKADAGQHDGAVRVGTITDIWQDGDLIRWSGNLMNTAEADEVTGLLAEGRMGISVDLDSTTMELLDDPEQAMELGQQFRMDVTGRIRAATLVDIPAFTGAYALLGGDPMPEDDDWDVLLSSGCEPCVAKELDGYYATMVEFAISDAAWDGSASRFTDEEWVRSTVVDRGESFGTAKERYAVPILEPNGDLNRAAVHNAAARINQVDAPDAAVATGKRRLVAAYRRLDEEPPESLTASAFAPGTKDGPGWITHPVPTQRLRNYWTRGPGAAKIRWGVPGDFNRCRRQLREYIANPQWLAGTCANLHHVALGTWPGRHGTRSVEGSVMASAFTIVDEEITTLPAAWFADPELTAPTPVTVTEEGRVFGHIAQWGTCHTGLGLSINRGDECTAAPPSATNYAYFRTGVIDTDQGEIPVGNLTMGIGHANDKASAMGAIAHYDNTDAVVADVVTGEDEFGIWFSGAMRPNLTPEQIRSFKASNLSGDWRRIGGDLELVAALAVNVPGFPVPRLSLAAAAGVQTALVAAGMVERTATEKAVEQTDPISAKEFAKAVEKELAFRQKTRKSKSRFRSQERKRLSERVD
jgi:hypothetical protein